MEYVGALPIVIRAVQDATDESGAIRYDITATIPGGGVIEVDGVTSASSSPDGSGIVRKAAPVGTEWPGFRHSSGQINAYIVELEASETCDDGGTPA